MEEEIEIWKNIPGYEGLYQVSNMGRVWSMPRKWIGGEHNGIFLKPSLGQNGYFRINLTLNGKHKMFNIHILMAIIFLNHKPDGHKIEVDHWDNDKSNNRLSNLQLITHRENITKDKKGCSSKYTGVCWDKYKWKARIKINGKRKHLGVFNSEEDASAAYQKALLELIPF